ncbi:hypothetical protein BDQ12DRAFT_138585 [Crucibulum laeve]|uniref:Uncharacterized protein n=1 Tax=Crucibulum laeve TaxID=68775 RepID=A0A5C3LZA1_9AGAR|nr:hypothetical protein BDQ12DRAFT_138585 [Crucibulum laeve]
MKFMKLKVALYAFCWMLYIIFVRSRIIRSWLARHSRWGFYGTLGIRISFGECMDSNYECNDSCKGSYFYTRVSDYGLSAYGASVLECGERELFSHYRWK